MSTTISAPVTTLGVHSEVGEAGTTISTAVDGIEYAEAAAAPSTAAGDEPYMIGAASLAR